MRVKWRGGRYKYLRLRIIPPFAFVFTYPTLRVI